MRYMYDPLLTAGPACERDFDHFRRIDCLILCLDNLNNEPLMLGWFYIFEASVWTQLYTQNGSRDFGRIHWWSDSLILHINSWKRELIF